MCKTLIFSTIYMKYLVNMIKHLVLKVLIVFHKKEHLILKKNILRFKISFL